MDTPCLARASTTSISNAFFSSTNPNYTTFLLEAVLKASHHLRLRYSLSLALSMSQFLFHAFLPNTPTLLSNPNRLSRFSPIRANPNRISASLPARDKLIDFGKHKGKPLGSIPSNYLQWITKNLNVPDYEDWVKLVEEVLKDPVYKDRIEWEFAERVMTGDSGNLKIESPGDYLAELSERFGWDFEDHDGWGRIRFELLGTSKGGRIPRKGDIKVSPQTKRIGALRKKKSSGEVGGKREERIERQKQRLGRGGKVADLGAGVEKKEDRVFVHDQSQYQVHQDQNQSVKKAPPSRFPGREGLLKKVLNDRKFN